jgi:very-short-patch-repair endonuclease
MAVVFAETAARQHGLVTRTQLVKAGLSVDSINRRLRSGALILVHRGVYGLPGIPDSFARRVMAALLAAGGMAAASHTAAATLHGIGELPPRVEISVPRSQRPRLTGVTVYRVSYLPAGHRVMQGGVIVTSLARTICDLASVLEAGDLELVLDEALARRRIRLATVRSMLTSLPGNSQGAGVLRALIDARSDGRARAESPLELRLHRFLKRAGFRGWETQQWVSGCRVDVAFPTQRLALQVDSYRHHSSRTDWARDHRRHTALVTAGWRVLPVTLEDLDREDELAAKLREALGTGSGAQRRFVSQMRG